MQASAPRGPLPLGSFYVDAQACGNTGFEPDGRVLYRAQNGKPDFGKTHFAPDANGLTAGAVLAVLTGALQSGDPELAAQAIGKLRAIDRFMNTVPRGAQTWEVPLHTPDILASAHLVRCYTIGCELTGEASMLEQARYWAYSGLPFVYLRQPTEGPVGLYATIPVFGATNWEAPNWLGMRVPWSPNCRRRRFTRMSLQRRGYANAHLTPARRSLAVAPDQRVEAPLPAAERG